MTVILERKLYALTFALSKARGGVLWLVGEALCEAVRLVAAHLHAWDTQYLSPDAIDRY